MKTMRPLIYATLLLSTVTRADDALPPNADPAVKYIGSERCAACHQTQHESFLLTAHSKAAQITDVADEPPPARFEHEPSGNVYEVKVVDGQMLHREFLRNDEGEQLALTQHPMVHTLGSGTHAKSYFFRDGPFHLQSPITYFSDDEQWSMSPGYDEPVHRGFRRTVTVTCVFCHVGSIEQIKRNPYKFEIVESKIGCERCHGPGELHEKRHLENLDWSGDDDTIVHPAELSRELAEALCHQCHTQGVQAINVSGKNDWDFRPGAMITDYRVDFQFRRGDNSMRLVGHVEQMHDSKCYTESDTLTCITCHDPHDPPPVTDALDYYRNKCFQCHDNDSCGEPLDDRVAVNSNDCSKCHMPRGETNVSHFALHDHRIAVHRDESEIDRSTDNAASFEPILDISYLPESEQRRLNGLAKYELHRRHGANPNFANFNIEAATELIQLKQGGMNDPDVDAALVWLARGQGENAIAEALAKQILETQKLETMPRIVATNILAQLAFERQDVEQAVRYYRELDKLHRDGRDIYYLGLSEQNARNTEDAIAALKRSIRIEPSQVAAHAALHAIYASTGRAFEAEIHRRAAEQNQQLQQRYARELQKMKERDR